MWKNKFGRCIFESSGGYGVYQNLRYRWLHLGSTAIQTLINRYHPMYPALEYIPLLLCAAKQWPGKTCLLGLGGAGVAHALAPYVGHEKIHAVEYSSEVISIGAAYFKINCISSLIIHELDANDFVQNETGQYKHVLIDLFDAKHFPKHCLTDVFFQHCKRILDPDGIMAINIANASERKRIFQLIQSQFNRSIITLSAKRCSNWVMLASQLPINALIDRFIQNKVFNRLYWDSEWGYVGSLNFQ